MWTKTFSEVYQDVQAKDVWRLWADINNWPAWHADLEGCHLEGAFSVGNTFTLKPKGMKAVQISITEMEEGISFTDCTAFPGAKMFDMHRLEETPKGLCIHNTITVTGPLAWVWIHLVAKKVAHSIPQKVAALVNLARGLHESS